MFITKKGDVSYMGVNLIHNQETRVWIQSIEPKMNRTGMKHSISIVTIHFCGPGRAIGPVVCLCVQTTTFQLNDIDLDISMPVLLDTIVCVDHSLKFKEKLSGRCDLE